MTNHDTISHDALAIWQSGVAAVDAQRLVHDRVRVTQRNRVTDRGHVANHDLIIADATFQLSEIDRLIVVGGGKASGWMAAGLEQALQRTSTGQRLLKDRVCGEIAVPDDQVIALESIEVSGCRPPGINLPTPRVVAATQRMLDLVAQASPRDVVVVMIAGGGSALMELPVPPLTLDDVRAVTQMLSRRGASIEQLNAVRKSISQIKSGGLAGATTAGNLVSLIVSDVMGDPIDVIASGPTVISPGNSQDPVSVLDQFDPQGDGTPPAVRRLLVSPAKTENSNSSVVSRPSSQVQNFVIGNNQLAVEHCRRAAQDLGYEVVSASTQVESIDVDADSRQLVDALVDLQKRNGKHCIISGGEPTVSPGKSTGRGGRNQHLVLTAAKTLRDRRPDPDRQWCLLSAGTDGEDGNVPVAGGWIDGELVEQLASSADSGNLDRLGETLRTFNSFELLESTHRLIRVPPTRTNVCDLRILLTK